MDILFITNIPTPYRTAFLNTLNSLCERQGVRLHVLYCALTEPRRNWSFVPEENLYSYEFLAGWHFSVRDMTFHLNPRIMRRLRALSPKVAIFAGAWNMPTNLLALTTIPKRTQRLFWSEGHEDAARNSSGIIPKIRRSVLRRFDGFVVPNRKSEEWIRAQVPSAKSFHLLPNTVDEDFYRRRSPAERGEARARLGIHKDERLIVQVSYLEPRKGVAELASAFADLVGEAPGSARLVFVGTGSEEPKVLEIARSAGGQLKISFTGHLDRHQVRDWLMAADVFALNTRQDPNPLSPIEAAFADLPLLLSIRAGNFSELVQEGVSGFAIADPDRPHEPLRVALTASTERLSAMGEASRRNAEAKFRREQICEALLNSLEGQLR